jgi:hypothetical protein
MALRCTEPLRVVLYHFLLQLQEGADCDSPPVADGDADHDPTRLEEAPDVLDSPSSATDDAVTDITAPIIAVLDQLYASAQAAPQVLATSIESSGSAVGRLFLADRGVLEDWNARVASAIASDSTVDV